MIKIYGGVGCSFCESAKNLCKAKNISFEYNDVADLSPLEWKDKIGFVPRSIPQILDDDKYIGGFAEFKTYIESAIS